MQSNNRRISLILGAFMAVVLIASAILPLLRNNVATTTADVIEPTDIPTPTYPPPVTDFSDIALDEVYLHPTGLYTIAQPPGWTITGPSTQGNIAQVGMNNGTNLSVIDAYVQKPETSVTTPEDISNVLTEDVMAQTWTRYNRWEESSRRVEDDRLLIDFAITYNRQQYVARQVSWTDGEYIYSVRVVVPENGIDLLHFLVDNLPATLTVNRELAFAPFNWQAYYDTDTSAIIRYPQGWTVQDRAPGRTASIIGRDGETLRLEFQQGAAALDEASATSFVEGAQSNATVLSVTPMTRDDISGYSVAYAYANVDGEAMSGLATILDGGDGNIYSANLRFPGANVDLNNLPPAAEVTAEPTPEAAADEAAAEDVTPTVAPAAVTDPALLYGDYATMMETFRVIPPINLNPANVPPTPTPLPTLEPSLTPTITPTPEATETEIPTDTPIPPTATPVHTDTPIPPTATPAPTDTPAPTATNTARPTNTPRPSATPEDEATATEEG